MRLSLQRERLSLLNQAEHWLETPMFILGFIWLILTVIELTGGLSPFMLEVTTAIWIIFVIDFVIKLTIAPKKLRYLRKNWITVLSLAVPALRVVRLGRVFNSIRILRAPQGLRLIKVVGSFNRGMRALARSLGRRGFGYVLGLTGIVTLLGAAGIFGLEHDSSQYIKDFGTALWWSAMTLTTMGTDYFPMTPEGRFLCLLLAIYGFAIFGYVTATVASFFVEREASSDKSDLASEKTLRELRAELAHIREELRQIRNQSTPGSSGSNRMN